MLDSEADAENGSLVLEVMRNTASSALKVMNFTALLHFSFFPFSKLHAIDIHAHTGGKATYEL